ncbi:D-aspartate oxidase isoform X2 [Schistocerca serialis cubense]|uniref:D-aspartate oxidase isoform X2 n=2 Tax=Schistocerca serialis cubense TaxID=2023355 RepID=UPI00214E89B7|nr:D-aspartate oxidase isoform X2 [Schistocerca serialis cubense]
MLANWITMSNIRIGVLGAGVVGVTTALELQKEYPSASLTIIADKFGQETTSDGAAGIFRPASSFCGPTEDISRQWINDSYYYYEDIRKSAEAAHAGVIQMSGYILSSINKDIVQNHYLEKLLPLFRRATEEELSLYPGNWKYGTFYTTLVTECRKFLPWGMHRFEEAGGQVKNKLLSSFNDVSGDFDIVVNCLGLGAKYLCSDHNMVPIRGQVLKVNAPWIKTFLYGDFDTYIIPGIEAATLGGCRNYDSYDLRVNRHDTASILERCTALVPSLKKASIIREWVGLRPHRSPVRVEAENINGLKVVHNYGHGGYGVTSAPGTAKHAVQLVKEMHSARSKL